MNEAKSLFFRTFNRRGLRWLNALAAQVRIWLKHGCWCEVCFDGDWIVKFPDFSIANSMPAGITMSHCWTSTLDLFCHNYRPKEGDVVLDIGAGIGTETVVFSDLVGQSGRVISVEAHPATFRCLCKTIALNRLCNVQAINCAVSDSAGTSGISDIDAHEGNTVLAASQNLLAVDAKTLDSIFEELAVDRIDLLKMNIEGAERRALLGFIRMIPIVQHVAISCHDFKADASGIPEMCTKEFVVQFLLENGFSVEFRLDDSRRHIRDYVYGERRD